MNMLASKLVTHHLWIILTLQLALMTSYLFAVAHKTTENEFECYQLVGSLREAIDLLMVELKDKQATINNLLDIINIFTINTNKRKEVLNC